MRAERQEKLPIRRRLYRQHFHGAGRYTIKLPEKDIAIDVDEHGEFDTPEKGLSYYAVSGIVGGKRDHVY